jgi:ABC-type thiamine transport system substrate-binding protein
MPISRATTTRRRTMSATLLATLLAIALLASCSLGGGSAGSSASTAKTVVLATHDSWAMSPKVLREFTRRSGYTVKVEKNGDAGALTNKLVLTKGSPIADATFGIDNTFASRAVDQGVLTPYRAPHRPRSAASYALPDPKEAARLTPIDYGSASTASLRRAPWTTWPGPPTATCSSPRVRPPARRGWRSCSPPSRSTARTGRRTGSA